MAKEISFRGPRTTWHNCTHMCSDCTACPNFGQCEHPIEGVAIDPAEAYLALLYAIVGYEWNGVHYDLNRREALAFATDRIYWKRQEQPPFVKAKGKTTMFPAVTPATRTVETQLSFG